MALNTDIRRQEIRRQKTGFYWIVIFGLIFCELFVYTGIRAASTQTILRISREQEAFAKKTSYYQALSVERDRLKSDERITRIAKTRLNLSSNTLDQTIYLTISPLEEK